VPRLRPALCRPVSDRADDSAHVDFTRFVERVASLLGAAVLEGYFSKLSNR
jgi:adenosylhomocysteine nucleosidase